jgi:hypothetical protein
MAVLYARANQVSAGPRREGSVVAAPGLSRLGYRGHSVGSDQGS